MISNLDLPQHSRFIDLETLQQIANFQERKDLKFLLPASSLGELWGSLLPNYRVLGNPSLHWFPYKTTYFDTPQWDCYLQHHQGKGNRFKIRIREYLHSGNSYLEIKSRDIHGITSKHREILIEGSENRWLLNYSRGWTWEQFHPVLSIHVKRQTWVKDDGSERITIDSDMRFQSATTATKTAEKEPWIEHLNYPNWVIVEIKSMKHRSELTRKLLELGGRPDSLSKYCWAVSALNLHSKKNLFLPHLKYISNHNVTHELADFQS